MKDRPVNMLLVEDNEGDVELIRIAFEQGNLSSRLAVTHNGMEALDYLYRRGVFAAAETPDLILLDLNMPRMGGKEFLNVVKRDERLKSIPVIVFTSSSTQRDIMESYQRHANSYVIKPFNIEEYIKVAKQVENFWVNLSQLPGIEALS